MISAAAAEKMDRQYRFQRHIYDHTRTHYLYWRERLIKELAPPAGGTVVEVACGTGWNLLRALKAYPDARVFGFDISKEMLRTAQSALSRQGFTNRAVLAQGDATAFDLAALFAIPSADRIFISYAVSMIPDWEKAVERAVVALGPGGRLAIVDFGRMETMPVLAKTAFRAFLAHYNVTPRDALEPVLREIAKRHGLAISFEQTRQGYAAYAVLEKA
ncbi:MAG: class I SAM-dependent methyltransferase [Hyphomicrobium sp.]